MHGATFGKITGAVVKGKVAKGVEHPAEERFKSSHMMYYENPREKKLVNPLLPEEEFIVESNPIPESEIEKFWGAGADSGMSVDKQVTNRKKWGETLKTKKGK